MVARHSAAVVFAALLPGLALSLAFGLAAVPGWSRATSPAGGDRPADADEDDDLDARRERLFREFEIADQLATRLAAGSLSLGAAAEQIEPLLSDRPGFAYTCTTYYHVPNIRLGAARYLIGKVERLLASDPARWAAASGRLEAEYAALGTPPEDRAPFSATLSRAAGKQ
jgi:hypothetical protein